MADDVVISTPVGVGASIAADEIAGVHHQRTKNTWGPDGTATDVDVGTAALPTQGAGAAGAALVGNPVAVGGNDGANLQALRVSTAGVVAVSGRANSGAAISSAPMLGGGRVDTTAPADGGDGTAKENWLDPSGAQVMAGFDGAAPQPLQTDVSGNLHAVVFGNAAAGAPATDFPFANGARAYATAPPDVGTTALAHKWLDPSGAQVMAGFDGANSQPVASTALGWQITLCQGQGANGVPASGAFPVIVGGRASSTLPADVADAASVYLRTDLKGSLVTTRGPRELVGDSQITLTSTAADTLLVAAGGAGIRRGLTELTLANSSATQSTATLRDGATIRKIVVVPPGGTVALTFDPPLAQAVAATAWNIQVESVASVYAFAKYLEA